MSRFFKITHIKEETLNSDLYLNNLTHGSWTYSNLYSIVIEGKLYLTYTKSVFGNSMGSPTYICISEHPRKYNKDGTICFQKEGFGIVDIASCTALGNLCSMTTLQGFQFYGRDVNKCAELLLQAILLNYSTLPYDSSLRISDRRKGYGAVKLKTGKYKGYYRFYKKHFSIESKAHVQIPYRNLVFHHNPNKSPYYDIKEDNLFLQAFRLENIHNSFYGFKKLHTRVLSFRSLEDPKSTKDVYALGVTKESKKELAKAKLDIVKGNFEKIANGETL